MSIEQDIVNYIAMTQPKLEKHAAFNKALYDKLIKSGLDKTECEKIYKEASENPASVFKYMDIPTFNRKYGDAVMPGSGINTFDPITQFILGVK